MTTPTPVTMAREAYPGSDDESDEPAWFTSAIRAAYAAYAAGVAAERTRLSLRLRARISVLSEEVDGAVTALEQVLAELGG